MRMLKVSQFERAVRGSTDPVEVWSGARRLYRTLRRQGMLPHHAAVAYEILGDDMDGAASMLDDYEFMLD